MIGIPDAFFGIAHTFKELAAYCGTMLTMVVPVSIISSSRAAARLTSMMRPRP